VSAYDDELTLNRCSECQHELDTDAGGLCAACIEFMVWLRGEEWWADV
jgi:hypothetical protein